MSNSTKIANRLIHEKSPYYLPNITVLVKTPDNKERLEKVAAYTKEYDRKDDKITFYLCENHACMAPFHEVEQLQDYLIEKVTY